MGLFRVDRMRVIAAILFCTVGVGSSPVMACLAHFHTKFEIVTGSALIVVGRVTAIQQLPIKPEEAEQYGDEPKPTIATVEVLKVIKGTCGKELRIRSGPISSCSMTPEHYRFVPNTTCVFAVKGLGADNVGNLDGGGILDVNETELVKAYLLRAKALRTDYLDEMRSKVPTAFDAGTALCKDLSQWRKSWPAEPDCQWFKTAKGEELEKWNGLLENEAAKAERRLHGLDIETIRVALALDWCFATDSWSDHAVWRKAAETHAKTHSALIAVKAREYWRDRLVGSGVVSRPEADEYLGQLRDWEVARAVAFPINPPWVGRKPSGPVTIDFILRFHSHDPAAMFRAYGMWTQVLESLDTSRVALIVSEMYGSHDDDVRQVARWAIKAARDQRLVSLITDRQHESPWECSWLTRGKNKDANLRAMIAAAYDGRFTDSGIAAFWNSLATGKCFEQVCITEAIDRLDKLERLPNGDDKEAKARRWIASAIRHYLDAAQASRRPSPTTQPSSAEYRAWFEAHPVKPK